MTNVGMLFLDDLRSFATWISDRGHEFLESTGADNEFAPLTVDPPPGLVICLRAESLFDQWPEMPWFRLADRVALLVDTSGADEEVRRWSRDEAQLKQEQLGNVVQVVFTSEISSSIVERALASVLTDAEWRTWTQCRINEPLPPGPWLQRELPRWDESFPPNPDDLIRLFVCGLCLPEGLPVFVDVREGKHIDLASGITRDLARVPTISNHWQTPVVLPGGRSWLVPAHDNCRDEWRVDGEWQSESCTGGNGAAIAIEPSGRIAWTGGRCMFYWRLMLDEGPVAWTPSSHSWPDGHAKKLYGFKDNDPLWVHLAPDASMCLSVYEHDVLLSPAPPIRWRKDRSIVVAERTRGEPRAVFFVRSDDAEAYLGEPALGDEDARDHRAVVCLGPNSDRRYTVGLQEPTWRLIGERAESLGGPDAGWVVYNSLHKPVLAGHGTLLAGWHRWIVFTEHQEIIRLDLETDERTRLCTVDSPVDLAVAIPNSPNMVVVSIQGDVARYRMV